MVMGAIEKMIHQTAWKDLEYLVVDLPPGTGDIHLSIAQTLQVRNQRFRRTLAAISSLHLKKMHLIEFVLRLIPF